MLHGDENSPEKVYFAALIFVMTETQNFASLHAIKL